MQPRILLACGLILCAAPQAQAIPSYLRDYQTGYVGNVYNETVHYDASADRLSYLGWDRFDYSNRLCVDECEPPLDLSFDGRFEWSVGVDESGIVTDPGWMRWYGDFGSGYELLASGAARHVEVSGPVVFPQEGRSQYSRLSSLFETGFLDPRVAGMGDHIWFDFEYQFDFRYITASLFSGDFDCGPGSTASPDGTFRCSPWSYSGLIGVKIPEPATTALFLLGLAVLGLARRPPA